MESLLPQIPCQDAVKTLIVQSTPIICRGTAGEIIVKQSVKIPALSFVMAVLFGCIAVGCAQTGGDTKSYTMGTTTTAVSVSLLPASTSGIPSSSSSANYKQLAQWNLE
jgi:hypothetical protein